MPPTEYEAEFPDKVSQLLLLFASLRTVTPDRPDPPLSVAVPLKP